MSGMRGMMGGMMGGMGSRRAEVSEHKLVRFFDLTAKPGRKYRYRIQLFVQDPNSPVVRPQGPKIPQRGFEPEVLARLAEVEKQPSNTKVYWRLTEWSEPSPVVELPATERLFVGQADGHDSVSTVTTSVGKDVLTRVPAVEAVGVAWDPLLAVDVPLNLADPEKDLAEPGAVFARTQGTFEIAHPINLTIHKLENYDYQSSLMLVDLRGGEQVGGDRENPIYNPSAALMVDSNGRLKLADELDDVPYFRAYTFADEETPREMSSGAGGFGGDMFGPSTDGGGDGNMSAPGMPGGMGPASGRGGRRGRGRGEN